MMSFSRRGIVEICKVQITAELIYNVYIIILFMCLVLFMIIDQSAAILSRLSNKLCAICYFGPVSIWKPNILEELDFRICTS